MDVVIGWRDFECEFMGERVTMQIRPLKRAAALKLAPYIRMGEDVLKEIGLPQPDGNGDSAGPPNDELQRLQHRPSLILKMMLHGFEMQELAAEILPEHLRQIDLTVNGKAPAPDDLANESVLSPLVGSILAELIRISFFGKRDLKNSGGPSVS